MRGAAIGYVVGAILLSACDSTGPKAPAGLKAPDVTGTWAGVFPFSTLGSACADLSFDLRQAQSTVTGTWIVSDCGNPGIQFQGSMTGSDLGDSLNLSLGQNGFAYPGRFAGNVNAVGDTIAGYFAGNPAVLIRH